MTVSMNQESRYKLTESSTQARRLASTQNKCSEQDSGSPYPQEAHVY